MKKCLGGILFVVLCSLLPQTAFPQNRTFLFLMLLNGGGKVHQEYNWVESTLVTSKNDTLSGEVSFYNGSLSFRNKSIKKHKILKYSEISYCALKRDSANLIVLEKIPGFENRLWRKVVAKKGVSIYDSPVVIDRINFEHMIITSDNNRELISSFWATSIKRYLVKKINKYLLLDLSPGDFKNKYAVINWLKNY